METELNGQAVFIYAIVKLMINLLIYYAIDTSIVRFARRITSRVSDRIMIPLGLSAVTVFVVGIIALVAKAHGVL
jgi:uncharacterized alkaline shock family protein YloU